MAQTNTQKSIFADVGNRAAALLLDLILLGVVTALAPDSAFFRPYAFPSLVFLYFAGMPLSPLQGTLGKWVCRIKLCDRLGRRLTWRSSVVRVGATMCWFGLPFLFSDASLFGNLEGASLSAIWWLLFALPWATTGFLPRRQSLFDLLAGSQVVRYAADTESIAATEPLEKLGILNMVGAVVLCLGTGAVLSVVIGAHRDMNRRARVAYAIAQTESLRQQVEAFHGREQRWPTAAELGVSEWTPYRDGGGYRLQTDGSILITFAVLPELKGHSITFRPTRAADGKKIHWQCSTDPGLKPGFVPGNCR